MPRPTKDDSVKLSAVLPPVRCTAEEKARIKARAVEAGLSLSEFIRQSALNNEITVKQGDIDFETYTQIRKIGVNLNQQTKRLNATGIQPAELDAALKHLNEILTRLMKKI